MTTADPTANRPLAGRRIAILEHRELDRLGQMLEAQGAATLRCPLVAIVDAPDAGAVRAWLRRFVDKPPDDLVLMTGEGLRRLGGFAAGAELEPVFRATLARVRTITRGPKPARALREIGLAPSLRAAQPTTAGVIAALAPDAASRGELRQRRVAVQLYPEAPDTLVAFLSQAGARTDPVTPYAYVAAAPDDAIDVLIDEMAAGSVDAIAFTSAAQVGRLFAMAGEAGAQARLEAALRRTPIAAVGPVVAGQLQRRGLAVAIMPTGSFFMKPLVGALAEWLSR